MALELSPQLEGRIRKQAATKGITIEQILEEAFPEDAVAQRQTPAPNLKGLAMLEELQARRRNRPCTPDTGVEIIREGRAGDMYDQPAA